MSAEMDAHWDAVRFVLAVDVAEDPQPADAWDWSEA